MRDLDRWKDKVELQLDGRQIFFLFFGSAVCACLIFVLGVVVGRRVEAQRSAAAPVAAEDPLAVLDELGNAEEGLTFHSTLGKGKGRPDKESKGDKAEAPEREDEAGKTPGKAEARAEGETPRVEAKPAAKGEPQGKPDGKAADKDDKKLAAAAKAAEKDKPKDKEGAADKAAKAAADKDSGKSHFTLQLSAFATKGEASEFMRRLRDAGYKPYLTESMIPGKGLMYRVRLGDYQSRDSALSAKSDFERKQKMVAYVAKL